MFTLPPQAADAGEQYLQVLSAADGFARDRRMLSLEAPVAHRVLREWYVGGLVSGLRRAAQRLPPEVGETFEARLLRELQVLEQARRASQLGALLQRVTARLAAAETVDAIAGVAVEEGVRALGAAGGTLARLDGGVTTVVVEQGADVGTAERYLRVPLHLRSGGPSSEALRSGRPVWVEGRAERDARYPHLAQVQPDAVALASVPLPVAGEVVGALRFSWQASHVFTDAERGFLDGLAAQTAQAVARATALQRLHDLRDELERLLQSPGRLSSTDLGVLRTLYDDAPVGIAVHDAQGRCLRVNALLAAANGLPAADHVGRTVADVLGPGAPHEERVRMQQLLDEVLTGGRAVERELDAEAGSGRVWRTSWFPVRDADEAVRAAVVLAVDITAQRRAEDRTRLLAQLGDRLGHDRTEAGVLDATVSAVVPALGDWAVVHLRDVHDTVWCALVRHRDPALEPSVAALADAVPVSLDQPYGPGRTLTTGQTREMREVGEPLLATLAGGDAELLARLRRADLGRGAVVPLLAGERTVGALSIGRAGGVLGPEELAVLEDVGRRAGVALEGVQALTSAVRLDLVLDAAEAGSYDWHVRTGHLDWDDRLFRLMDLDAEQFDGTVEDFFVRLHDDDRPRVRAELERAVASGGDLDLDYRVVRRDGALRWVEARGRALAGTDGRTERIVGTAVDVSERREADVRTHRSLELMADAFFGADPSGLLTYVNREAERLLATTREQLLGRPVWEVLADPAGSPSEPEYRRAVATGRAVRFEQSLPARGRHVEVRAHPGPDGLAVYVADVTERVAAEHQRDRALARLQLIDQIGAALTATFDVDEALSRLAGLLVPALGDLASIDVLDADEVRGARGVVLTASDPAKADLVRRADELLARRHNPAASVYRVLHGEPLVHLVVTPEYLQRVAVDPEQYALYAGLDLRHALVVPLVARERVFGVLSLLRTGQAAEPFAEEDRTFALEVGRRAGLMIDNAAQYTAQRRVAEGLQRSLLPELPQVEGYALGASYEPSSSSAGVGGDWYDAFVLPDGGLGLVIGDVMGHDIAAAAAMGQLRSVLRSCAADGDPPAVVLDRLDRLVSSFAMADLATVVYARLDRRPDGSALLTWANAGHPPPLLLAPDGTARYLEDGGSVMIGAPSPESRGQASQVLAPGSTLLMVTDGVVERRGRDLDEQLAALATTAALLAPQVPGPDELCRRLLAAARHHGDSDDAAAVALTLR